MTTQDQTIPVGYKQTEVGVIPIDWEVKNLPQISWFQEWPGLRNWQFTKSWIKVINVTNLENWFLNLYRTDRHISLDEFHKMYEHFEINEHDIVIASSWNSYWKVAVVRKKDLPLVMNTSVIRFKPQKVDYRFLLIFLKSEYFKKQIDLLITWGAQPNFWPFHLNKILIQIPNPEEQTLIATVLSDIDELITQMDELIAKKKLIKQWTMQKLLTPKKDWEVKKLGEIWKTYGGLSWKTKKDFADWNSSYIPFMNIMSNPIIDIWYLDRVYIKNGESQHCTLKWDIFFNGSSETPEEVGMCSVLLDDVQNLYLNSFCFGFRLYKEQNINWLYLSYFFRSIVWRQLIYSLAQWATRYNLSKTNFLNLEISLPKSEEQNQIVTILSDIDNEIQQLEQKKSKYEWIKQWAMQQLLTGKIRLK